MAMVVIAMKQWGDNGDDKRQVTFDDMTISHERATTSRTRCSHNEQEETIWQT